MFRPVSFVLVAAKEETLKYTFAVEAFHASFTPFVVSVDGALSKDTGMFLCCLVVGLE